MNKDFAIIATGGKQYRVGVGDKLKVEKLAATDAGAISFDKVLLRSVGENLEIGAPSVAHATVEAKLLRNAKEKTKIVFKFHAKARYRKKKGHRQQFTEVEIVKI
jgi:large subunit ribosomal protein L21